MTNFMSGREYYRFFKNVNEVGYGNVEIEYDCYRKLIDPLNNSFIKVGDDNKFWCFKNNLKYAKKRAREFREIKRLYESGAPIKYYNNFIEIGGKTYNGYNVDIVTNLVEMNLRALLEYFEWEEEEE